MSFTNKAYMLYIHDYPYVLSDDWLRAIDKKGLTRKRKRRYWCGRGCGSLLTEHASEPVDIVFTGVPDTPIAAAPLATPISVELYSKICEYLPQHMTGKCVFEDGEEMPGFLSMHTPSELCAQYVSTNGTPVWRCDGCGGILIEHTNKAKYAFLISEKLKDYDCLQEGQNGSFLISERLAQDIDFTMGDLELHLEDVVFGDVSEYINTTAADRLRY